MPDEMESVEDGQGVRGMTLHRSQVGSPHVQADGLDRAGAPLPQPGKEQIHGSLSAPLTHPEQSSSLQIVEQSEVRVPFLATDFINAQNMQGLCPRSSLRGAW